MQINPNSAADSGEKVPEYHKEKCDILLIPPISNPLFTDDYEQFMPLGLLSLSSSIRKNNFSSIIFQPRRRVFKKEEFTALAKEILQFSPRIIGFSTWCSTFPTTLRIARTLKSLDPDILIIFGGPQASLLHRETLGKFPFVDFILRGEADRSLILFLETYLNGKSAADLKNIPGLTFRYRNEIVSNDESQLIQDLDDLPVPDYQAIPLPKHVKLDVGRGCPFRCTFCSTSDYFSKKYRVKSAERIIREMDHCYKLAKITRFGLAHDMFPLRESFVLDFCKKLVEHKKKKNRNYTWTCSARTDCLTEKMLRAMKRSGCTDIFVGIESGSPRIQKLINKNLDLDYAKEIIFKGISHGIRMTASFMAGFPSEIRSELEQTLKAVLEIAASGAKVQMSLLSVLPGTPLYENHKENLKYDGYFSDFSSSIFGQEELRMIQKDPDMFSSFYYLPVIDITRKTYIMVSELVNQVRIFPKTLELIWDGIKNDLHEINLLDHIEKRMARQKDQDRNSYPELTFLIDCVQEVLPYIPLNGKSELARDLFLFESSQYLLLRNFARKQLIEPRQKIRFNEIVSQESLVRINPLPFWTIISTHYKISDILEQPPGMQIDMLKLKKGKHTYLLIANAENNVKWYPINKRHMDLYDRIIKMNGVKYKKMKEICKSSRISTKWVKELVEMEVLEVS